MNTMNTMQPVVVTFTDGRTEKVTVNRHNLIHNYLSHLDMRDVASIEFGESVVNKGPAEVRLVDITTTFRTSEEVQYVDIYDKQDKRVAFAKTDPIKLQQFAVNILQQTTYRFADVQREHEEMKFRLDGLDK